MSHVNSFAIVNFCKSKKLLIVESLGYLLHSTNTNAKSHAISQKLVIFSRRKQFTARDLPLFLTCVFSKDFLYT